MNKKFGISDHGEFCPKLYYVNKFEKLPSMKAICYPHTFTAILNGRDPHGIIYEATLISFLEKKYRKMFEVRSAKKISIDDQDYLNPSSLQNQLRIIHFLSLEDELMFSVISGDQYCTFQEILYPVVKNNYSKFLESVEGFKCDRKSFNSTKPPQVFVLDKDPYGELCLTSSDIKQVVVPLEENYNDDIMELEESMIQFLSNNDGGCGLCLLHGNPSGGKTTYIRHLIQSNRRNRFVFVPPTLIDSISSPTFTSFLRENASCIFIIEDAESILRKRGDGTNNEAVSNLLQMSDGILSDLYNIKIIATFNVDVEEIDNALTRKGRLHFKYNFSELSIDKAKNKAKILGIDPDKITEPTMLGDIYNLEIKNGKDSGKLEKSRIGFN